MVAGIFHQGSGLGNQLFRYVTTRCLALDKGYEWGMRHPEWFKGSYFMNLDMGTEFSPFDYEILDKVWQEKKIVENGVDIRGYDPEINFVQDNTIIDGEFQDERYWGHRLPEIREWLKPNGIPPIIKNLGDNECIINFRGGEYAMFPDLFLPQSYWDEAIEMKKAQGVKTFEVHTDDVELAKQFFPNFPIWRDIQINWLSIRYAKHLILSNSSFAILPALLNENVKEIIAPRYWARHNTKTWSLPQNYYKKFTYI